MHEDGRFDRRAWARGFTGQLLFVLSLWMSLATAIVCAVVPAGLPATRAVGSAFDPSTTIVALRSTAPVAGKAAMARPDGGDGAGVGGHGGAAALVSASALPVIVTMVIAATTMRPAPVAGLRARAIDNALYARPPPGA